MSIHDIQMDSNKSSQAPDRWLCCPPYGEVIDDTFLPMKTLLSDDVQLPPDYIFTPDLFLKQMREKKLKIGLVINLTFSSKYYDASDIEDHDIEFKQISCRGFNEAPQPKERAEFTRVCNSFIAKNPKKIIAVHCTHGFNRTGFMICQYLCSERDWDISAAVAHFASKRPPGIYKQQYINELFNLFGDSDDPITEAPPKPIWDDDNEQMANLLADESLISNNNQVEFYEGITDVELVRDVALKQRIYMHCCQLCQYRTNSSGINFPGAQPVSMDLNNLQQLKMHRYRVSWKADGCRYMMYIQDEYNVFFLTRSLQLWRVNGLRFPRIDDLDSHLTDTLVDGEMVTDVINGQNIPKYLIYDVISLNGDNNISQQDFDKRCGVIKCTIIEARRKAKRLNLIPMEGEPFKVADKGFFYIQSAKKTWELNVTHEKDGLIFQPFSAPYSGGTCEGILKWKPPSLNSIDFKLVIREERQNGCLPEKFAYLHVSNKAEPITKIRLTKDQSHFHQYNNKIVEMTRIDGKWDIIRERSDKLHANSYETAYATFQSIIRPVTEKILFDLIASIPPEPKK